MSMSKQPREVTFYNKLDALSTDVKELFTHAEVDHVESSLDWYRCLIESVFPDPEVTYLAVARCNGQPMAALWLMQIDLSSHCVEALSNYYTAIYAPILAEQASAADVVSIIQGLQRKHRRLGRIKLAPMDPVSRSYQILTAALRTAGWMPFGFFCFGNWFHPINETWPDYLKAREGSVRSTIKRMGKKFAADGGTLELVCGGVQLDAAIDAYQQVYAASWKVPEPYPAFIPSLVHACAQRGWLRLGVARLKGRPIAVQLWIVAHGKANIYKLAYHEDFKSYAPGTLLTAFLMQHVIEQDHVDEVDYLIGDDAYKKAWMSQRRERWGIVAYNPRSVAGFSGLARELLGRTVKAARSRLRSTHE